MRVRDVMRMRSLAQTVGIPMVRTCIADFLVLINDQLLKRLQLLKGEIAARSRVAMSGFWHHTSDTPIQVTDREPTSINVPPTHHFTHPATASSPESRPYNDHEDSPSISITAGVGQDDDLRGNAAEYSPQPRNLQTEADLNGDTYALNNPFFEYRNLVGSISEKLRKENALRLAYVYALPEWYYEVGPTHDPTSALRILMALEGKGVFAPNNLAGLTKALETIEREDLAQLVREFRKFIHATTFFG